MKLNNKFSKFILIVILIVVGFAVYSNSLHGDFLIDDHAAILYNPRIRDLGVFMLKSFSLKIGTLPEFFHAIIWHFSGNNPYGFHLFSVFLHIACVISLFFLVNILFTDLALAFLSSLIFAVHPIHTEAVSWISGSPYALSSFFFILSFVFYVKSRKSLFNLFVSIVLFALCFFSGNSVAVLPLIFISYNLFFKAKEVDKQERLKNIILAAVFIASVLFVGSLFFSRNIYTRTIFHYRGLGYLMVITKAFVYYLKILYMPLQRGLYHPFAFNSADIQKVSPAFFFSLSILATSIIIFFKTKKSMAPLAFGLMWFLITFSPYSNIIPICNIISERYLYLPSVGFCIIVAYLFLKAWRIISRKSVYKRIFQMWALLALILYLGSYAALTFKRNYEYRNIIVYWQSNIRNFKDGYFVYNNLAGTFYAMGDKKNAIAYSWINLLTNSKQPHVWSNLGKVYREIGDLKMALDCYHEALKLDPKFYPAVKALDEINKEKNKQK